MSPFLGNFFGDLRGQECFGDPQGKLNNFLAPLTPGGAVGLLGQLIGGLESLSGTGEPWDLFGGLTQVLLRLRCVDFHEASWEII